MLFRSNTFTYSKVIKLRNEKSIGAYLVYPNPFCSVIHIEVNSVKNDEATIRVINSEGKTLKFEHAALRSGINNIILKNVAGYTQGSYVIEVTAGGESRRMQVVKE